MYIPEEEKHSPQYKFALQVVERLRSEGFQAYWAGGCVRDLLLNRKPGDYDVATSARPEEVRNIFGNKRTFSVGANFGVIIVHGPHGSSDIEIATFRNDGAYIDGRRPESVIFSSPEEDAQRRDFTINGMFFDPVEEKIIDFVDGEKDLREGIVKAIGNPLKRIEEDKLRMLRAVRFTATLEFELDEKTAEAIRNLAPEIHQVSEERITQEWRKMILDSHREYAIELIDSLGLLKEIFPELLYGNDSFEKHPGWERTCTLFRLLHKYDATFEVTLALFIGSLFIPDEDEANDLNRDKHVSMTAGKICRRMRLSNNEKDEICWLLLNQNRLDKASEMPLCDLKRSLSHKYFQPLSTLIQVSLEADGMDDSSLQFCLDFIANHPESEINPAPLVTGEDLIKMGMKPGPKFKETLNTLRDSQLNLEITSRDDALELAKRLNSN